MKLVVAIVRPEKLNDVLEALYRAEVRGLTISRVRGMLPTQQGQACQG